MFSNIKRANIYKLQDDDKEIVLFVKKLFTFLKKNNMCFLSGTIIFEDNNNKLFNFLTYNSLTENSIECSNKVKRTNGHISITHNNVYDKQGVTSAEKCAEKFLNNQKKILHLYPTCNNNKCFKMEFIFKDVIDYLCDQETLVKDLDKNNISNKRVILYYRFNYNNKDYLFFKLEEYNMNSVEHLKKFADLKRNDTYDKRRENETNYDIELSSNDKIFYDKILKYYFNNSRIDILKNIEIYNTKLRTGRELFIFEELKEYLLLNNNISSVSDIKLSDSSVSDIKLSDISVSI